MGYPTPIAEVPHESRCLTNVAGCTGPPGERGSVPAGEGVNWSRLTRTYAWPIAAIVEEVAQSMIAETQRPRFDPAMGAFSFGGSFLERARM